jgi:hypothetical protein
MCGGVISPVAVVRMDMAIRMSHAMWLVTNRRGRFDRISCVLWTNAECALKTAHDSTNRAAYNRTNWPGGIASNVRAVGDSVGNPLRVGGQWRTQHHYRSGDKEDSGLHGKDLVIGWLVNARNASAAPAIAGGDVSEIASEDRLPRRTTGECNPNAAHLFGGALQWSRARIQRSRSFGFRQSRRCFY